MDIEYQPDKKTVNLKLKWLMSIRLLFALLLTGSTVAYQIGNHVYTATPPVLLLYLASGTIVLFAAVYGIFFSSSSLYQQLFICSQIIIDSLFVTLVVFVTGGSSSIFPFLYLLVIIYASVFIYKRGSLVVAAICAIQFTVLLIYQATGYIDPYGLGGASISSGLPTVQALQKSGILTVACFSVAFLSGYLSDQERQSKAELMAMEAHLGRVQSLAQIGEMASGLAHEIKNPLASISGAIQILNSEKKFYDKDSMHLMNIVLRETDRLSCLVNNFLIFARPSVGQAKRVNLCEEVHDIVDLFNKDKSVRQRIEIELDLMPTAYIEFDPMQLRQVLWNLFMNSAESIEQEGKIKVTISQQKSDRIRVEIFDTGCGMDEKTMQSIFNPFFTTKSRGTGLGLSIVHRILETYGCRLDVKSKPAEGSVFTLHFTRVGPMPV